LSLSKHAQHVLTAPLAHGFEFRFRECKNSGQGFRQRVAISGWYLKPRPVPISARTRSSRFSVVEVEQSTESLATSDRANAVCVWGNAINQGIPQPLMVSFAVVVPHVLRYRPSQVPFSQQNHAFQTLGLYGKNESPRSRPTAIDDCGVVSNDATTCQPATI
jgi:hypothetical protein